MAGSSENEIESDALAAQVFVRPDGRSRPMVVWVGKVTAALAVLYLATLTLGLLGVSWVPPVHIPLLDAALPTPDRPPSLGDDAVVVGARTASPSGDVTSSLIVPTSDAPLLQPLGVDEEMATVIDAPPTAALPAVDSAPASSRPNPTTTALSTQSTSPAGDQLTHGAIVSATTPSTAHEVPPTPAMPGEAPTVLPQAPPETSTMLPATSNTRPPQADTGGAPSDTRPSKP